MVINTKKIFKTYIIFIVLVLFYINLALLVKAGDDDDDDGCTPTSPPSCAYRSGCYNKEDKHVDFGSLTPVGFGSYYGVNACIRSQHDNGCGGTNECNCVSGVYVDESRETEPDSSSGACNCIAGLTGMLKQNAVVMMLMTAAEYHQVFCAA